MFPLGSLLLAAITSVMWITSWKVFRFVYHQCTSPLSHLRGPKSSSLIYGNMGDIRSSIDQPKLYDEWLREYGNTMRYKGFFNTNQLLTLDTRAIHHILTHSNDYQKEHLTRYMFSQVFGEGVFVLEGAQHRQQRHIMNPAFGPGQIRVVTDIFFAKATRLSDLWSSEIAKDSAATTTGARIDVVSWLSRVTLDVIGLAGFNYDFGALNADGKPNELNEAFSTVFSASQKLSVHPVLQAWIPPLRLIPAEHARRMHAAHLTMARIGKELLANARVAARGGAAEKDKIEKDNLDGRDMLSLLVRANMATDIPQDQRLCDKDVLAEITTLFVAGQATTSTAVIWALYAMSQAPQVQTKLREELLSVGTDTPSMDDLTALPYLDVVVRETLRVYPPIPMTSRIAMKDDILPVEKPFTDKHGVVHDMIRVSKGDAITIPILAMNHSTELWGPDAHEFKPERWTHVPEATSQVPGVWGHMLTFLGGTRACIGYRFGLAETKAILFTLVRTFEFALAVPSSEVGSKAAIVQRPVLRSDLTNKGQLPLFIRPHQKT